MERIAKRGRDYENSISIRYLEDLNNAYEDWIGSYQAGNLLTIDVNMLDYASRQEDFGYVVKKVDANLHGLFNQPPDDSKKKGNSLLDLDALKVKSK